MASGRRARSSSPAPFLTSPGPTHAGNQPAFGAHPKPSWAGGDLGGGGGGGGVIPCPLRTQTPKRKALRGDGSPPATSSARCSPKPPRAQHRVLPAPPCAAVALVPSQGVGSIVPAPPQLADPPLWAHRRSPRCTAGSRTTTLSSSKCSPSLPRHEGRPSPSPSSHHLPRYRPLRLSPRPESTRGCPLGVCAVLQAPSPIQKKKTQKENKKKSVVSKEIVNCLNF